MSEEQHDAAFCVLRAIENDLAAIKLLMRDATATIDRILAMPLPSGRVHA